MKRFFTVLLFGLIGCVAFSQNASGAVQETDNKVYMAVEHQAVPHGGIKKFYADFVKEFKSPSRQRD